MVEYYGWISIVDFEYDSNGSEYLLEAVSKYIHEKKMDTSPGNFASKIINGNVQTLLSGATNHFSEDVQDIIDFYYFISKLASGSYGVLYLRDDEDSNLYNQFQVFVLAKGKVNKVEDPFLSPCIPVIEDESID